MIAKDLLPWLFVKRTDRWTPYVRLRVETFRREPAAPAKASRRPERRPPRA